MDRKKQHTAYGRLGLLFFCLLYSLAYVERFGADPYSRPVFGSIGYALGSFCHAGLVRKWDSRKIIFCGTAFSGVCSLLLLFADRMPGAEVLWMLNGYVQSMLWIGGIRLIKETVPEERYGVVQGLVNACSGMGHLVLLACSVFAGFWISRVLPLAGTLLFLLGFLFFTGKEKSCADRETEEVGADRKAETGCVGFEPEEACAVCGLEDARVGRKAALRSRFDRREIFWWCSIAFLTSLCRYGLLNWIPIYYDQTPQTFPAIPALYEGILSLGMVAGTLLVSILTERYFAKNRGIPAAALAACCAVMVAIFPVQRQALPVIAGIFFAGFFLYGINGILWLQALSEKRPEETAFLVGLLNGCAYLGTTAEDGLSHLAARWMPNDTFVFFFMETICILAMLCALSVCRKNVILLKLNK